MQEKQKEKRKRHIWIPILNVILVIIVVIAMLLMVVSELVLDKGVQIFGYSFETVSQTDLLIIKDALEVVQIPYAAAVASYVNSVPGYVTVIFPPCVLLVILQVIASSIEKKQEAKKKAEEAKAQPVQKENPHVYRPVIAQNAPEAQSDQTVSDESEDVQVQELKQNIEQLKAALQQSQTQNEELRIRAVQAIKKAREQSPPQGTIYQQPYPQMPQMPQYPVYPMYPVYPPQQYYPQQGYYPPQMPPQGGFYPYPPQQGPMR